MKELAFSPPRRKNVVLERDVWVKGKGLPKNGVCLFREGTEVTIVTDNGAEWYILTRYKGKTIRIATIF